MRTCCRFFINFYGIVNYLLYHDNISFRIIIGRQRMMFLINGISIKRIWFWTVILKSSVVMICNKKCDIMLFSTLFWWLKLVDFWAFSWVLKSNFDSKWKGVMLWMTKPDLPYVTMGISASEKRINKEGWNSKNRENWSNLALFLGGNH